MTSDIEGLRRSESDGERPLRMTIHAQVEAAQEEVVLVTAYVPDESEWIGYSRRRRRKGQGR